MNFKKQTKTRLIQKIEELNREIESLSGIDEQLKGQKEFYEKILKTANVIPWEMDCENDLFLYVGEQAEKILGYPVKDWYKPGFFSKNTYPGDIDTVKAIFKHTFNEDIDNILEFRLVSKQKETVWVRCYISVIKTEMCKRLSGFMIDISEHKKIEASLRESEERFELAINGANDGLWDWDIEQDTIFFTPRWKNMLGYQDSEIGNNSEEWFSRINRNDKNRVVEELESHLKGSSRHFQAEYRILHKSGTYIWVLTRGIAFFNEEGKATRMAGSQTDISERKIVEGQLLHDSLYDELTELPNRVLFVDRLKQGIRRAKEDASYDFAVLLIDLDRFKIINDSMGYEVGDKLLLKMSHRLEACIGSEDTLARLGGDEFAILLSSVKDIIHVTRFAELVLKISMLPIVVKKQRVSATMSIGLILNKLDYDKPDDILRDAETAMYQAKNEGRARYKFFKNSMRKDAIKLLKMEDDLHMALERQEFEIHYQAIVSLLTNKVEGFEALLRWKHPLRGYIYPDEFIPVAEETGLIIPIGEWVIKKVCSQIQSWNEAGHEGLTISVNFSARQFERKNMVSFIKNVLTETGLSPECFKMEITESVTMRNLEYSRKILRELSNIGIKILIDDFGTGYSSLAYLKWFPIDILKIDKSFVFELLNNSGDSEIVSAIIAMAHRLNIRVIAEGVEDIQQFEFLKKNNCDYAQGYYISKPIPSYKAVKLLG
ncbi:MAG: EAL domain-containing protein [Spirochaetes bacterium]|nr:EAL domain-containing protein [Spirochaetota bacterium]